MTFLNQSVKPEFNIVIVIVCVELSASTIQCVIGEVDYEVSFQHPVFFRCILSIIASLSLIAFIILGDLQ